MQVFQSLVARTLTLMHIAAAAALLVLLVALLAGIGPSLLGDESFVVATSDMQPALQMDDLAVVEPISAETLSAGDVVAYRTPEAPASVLIRRIASVSLDPSGRMALEARADADPTTQQIVVAPGAILGRLIYRVPRVGMLVNLANLPLGKVLLVGLPALLLAADWLRSWRRRRQKRVPALVEIGRRALRAGQPHLAVRAAEGALALEPYNRAAWLLQKEALRSVEKQRGHAAA